MDYTKISTEQINKAAKLITKQGNKMQELVQLYGLAALYQVQEHGNVTPLCTLYKALPAGMRTTAFAMWAVQAGGVRINEDKNSKESVPLAFDKHSVPNLSLAEATPWYKVKSEKTLDEVAFDIDKALARILKMAANNPKGTTNPELLKRLQEAVVPKTISADVQGTPEPVKPTEAALVAPVGITLPALPAQFA